jgi:protein required for attachment to host cells
MDARTDPTEVETEHFARMLCGRLADGVDHGEHGRVVLVAPPHFLGVVRHLLPPSVNKRVVASIDRDLTRVSVNDLPTLVARHLPN